jgi:hypothetical protein
MSHYRGMTSSLSPLPARAVCPGSLRRCEEGCPTTTLPRSIVEQISGDSTSLSSWHDASPESLRRVSTALRRLGELSNRSDVTHFCLWKHKVSQSTKWKHKVSQSTCWQAHYPRPSGDRCLECMSPSAPLVCTAGNFVVQQKRGTLGVLSYGACLLSSLIRDASKRSSNYSARAIR